MTVAERKAVYQYKLSHVRAMRVGKLGMWNRDNFRRHISRIEHTLDWRRGQYERLTHNYVL